MQILSHHHAIKEDEEEMEQMKRGIERQRNGGEYLKQKRKWKWKWNKLAYRATRYTPSPTNKSQIASNRSMKALHFDYCYEPTNSM